MRPVDVDIDDILEDISRVLYERETGRSQSYHSEVREVNEVIYLLPGAWQSISDSLLALDQSLAPLEAAFSAEDQALPRRVVSRFKNLFKRVIRKAVYWYVNPVIAQLHSVHQATDRSLHEIADLLGNVNGRLESLEKSDFDSRVEVLEGERFDERIGRLERAWRQRIIQDSKESTHTDQIVPGAETGHEQRGVGRGRSVPPNRRKSFTPFHFDYYWFESIHRGDRDLIKRRQQPYLEYFLGCENVLDIGCGRGEFLELMEERDVGGYGIDIEGDAVQYCLDAGLKAEPVEAIEHLYSLADESLDGAFISQVAEHMTPGELTELVGLLYQKMKPGGYVVLETPNPQCLLIFASFFYADLSHVQPIHPETMRFLLLSVGFRDVEIKLTNPVPKNQRLEKIIPSASEPEEPWVEGLNKNFQKLNSVLFSHMDYAAIARK